MTKVKKSHVHDLYGAFIVNVQTLLLVFIAWQSVVFIHYNDTKKAQF